MSSIPEHPRFAMRGIRKTFGATVALDNVDFAVSPGEIHALIGENGAGKSTLMKVLSGALQPDAGEMTVDGSPFAPANPLQARQQGVAMIYQELSLAPHLTVAENVLLGMEITRRGLLQEIRHARPCTKRADGTRPCRHQPPRVGEHPDHSRTTNRRNCTRAICSMPRPRPRRTHQQPHARRCQPSISRDATPESAEFGNRLYLALPRRNRRNRRSVHSSARRQKSRQRSGRSNAHIRHRSPHGRPANRRLFSALQTHTGRTTPRPHRTSLPTLSHTTHPSSCTAEKYSALADSSVLAAQNFCAPSLALPPSAKAISPSRTTPSAQHLHSALPREWDCSAKTAKKRDSPSR